MDLDAFFAAVEERDKSYLEGMPIVVGADPKGGKGRGVVSTANYKAREYGIRSALPISKAWQFSEQARQDGKQPAIFVEPNFERYSAASDKIMTIVRRHVSAIEEASIDEAYFDLTLAGSYEKSRRDRKKDQKGDQKFRKAHCFDRHRSQ